MGSLGTPETWVPYDNLKDCSQGFCSLYCPQWCYINFAPPPPYGYPDDDSSGTNFSPLVIAIIGILASAFLLVSYYTVISKYCGNFDSLRRRGGDNNSNDESNENENPSNLEPWQVSTAGLDEKLIKSITVCKYKKGDGFVEGTDCSVCLSEFQEDESLRLLPKCSHAFHLYCIDTWLKSHSNCPLCRANIVPISPLPLQLPSQVQQNPSPTQPENIVVAMDELETRNNEEVVPQNDDNVHQDDAVAKTPNMENSEARDTIIEIREEETEPIRRSVSMDASCHNRVSMADILCMSEDEASSMDDQEHHIGIGSSSKLPNVNEHNKYSNRSRVLHSVASPVPMKRSFSSGRFLFTRQGRGKNVIMPM